MATARLPGPPTPAHPQHQARLLGAAAWPRRLARARRSPAEALTASANR